jgi:hypothetical protein
MCLAVVIGILLIPPAHVLGQSVVPALRAPLPDTPYAPSALRAKMGGSSSAGPDINDAEIEELARGLKYDPGLIYKFVHDHIHFDPIWGELKGPYMAWMDRSGTSFDQATLMIALLKHAATHSSEYTITNPKYVVGEIQVTAEQALSWLNIPTAWYTADTARELLARCGRYGTVTVDGDRWTAMNMEHVWVKVTIDGQTYEFDPSFKTHTKTGGLSLWDLDGAMGYDHDAFLSDATYGATIDSISVKDLNKTNISNDLTGYSRSLRSYIKSHYPDESLKDLIGGKSIDAAEETALPPSSLPYTVVSRDQEFAIESVPNLYRTTLRVQHCGIDQTFKSCDIYGRRLSLKYNGSNQPQLILDGTVKATGNATTPGQSYDLIYTVDHPFEVTDFDATVTLKVTAGGFYGIVNGWGDTGASILSKHRRLLQEYRTGGYSDSSEEVLGHSYALVGLTWLSETSLMRSLADDITNHIVVNHHMLGVAGQYTAPYIDMAVGHIGLIRRKDSYNNLQAAFCAIAGHASAYEHQVIRQLQDCNAVSTIRLMEMANDRTTYDKIYSGTSANWSGTIQPLLQNYSQAEKDQVSQFINAGFQVNLPQYGDLAEEDWTGIGF